MDVKDLNCSLSFIINAASFYHRNDVWTSLIILLSVADRCHYSGLYVTWSNTLPYIGDVDYDGDG